MSAPPTLHGCTISTPGYLAHARVLAESFLAHNRGSSFSVLTIDESPADSRQGEDFEVLRPIDVGIDQEELHRRGTMYVTQGLATSMKPNLLLTLLERLGEPVVFLDADGCVYEDLGHLGALAHEHSLILSPHSLDPHPLAAGESPEQLFLRAGVMNAGLVGVGAGGDGFLRWWAQRTERDCIIDQQRGILFEQNWLTLAPAIFEHHVLRDRGCNVAGWNLHSRDVRWEQDAARIDGGPLRHFHFAAGYDPERPDKLTTQSHASWWPTLQERPGVARLSREYAARLIDRGYREANRNFRAFSETSGGRPIEPWMRTRFRVALLDAEREGTPEPPNPFTDGEEPFLQWLTQSASERVERELADADRSGAAAADDAQENYHELMLAMTETRNLLGRIAELEDIRDDAVGWAERVSRELQESGSAIAERDELIVRRGREIAELDAEIARREQVLNSVFSSVSWRATRPLRLAKDLLSGRGR